MDNRSKIISEKTEENCRGAVLFFICFIINILAGTKYICRCEKIFFKTEQNNVFFSLIG